MEEMTKTINFSNEGEINSSRVMAAVYNRIDFELPENIWQEIDLGFAECWNNEIGLRGWIHEGQIESFISKHLKKKRIIFDFEKVERIVGIIFEYIQMTGGFLKG